MFWRVNIFFSRKVGDTLMPEPVCGTHRGLTSGDFLYRLCEG